MERKRFPGLRERAEIWHIEKQIFWSQDSRKHWHSATSKKRS